MLSDRRKCVHEKAEHKGGYFYTLHPRLQESLVEYARLEAAGAREAGRQALKAHEAEKMARQARGRETGASEGEPPESTCPHLLAP